MPFENIQEAGIAKNHLHHLFRQKQVTNYRAPRFQSSGVTAKIIIQSCFHHTFQSEPTPTDWKAEPQVQKKEVSFCLQPPVRNSPDWSDQPLMQVGHLSSGMGMSKMAPLEGTPTYQSSFACKPVRTDIQCLHTKIQIKLGKQVTFQEKGVFSFICSVVGVMS